MATRLITASDLARAKLLDDAALEEKRADWGALAIRERSPAEWQALLNSSQHRVIGYVRNGVLRGYLIVLRTPNATPYPGLAVNGWQIVDIVTDKGLTAAQRLAGFDEVRRFAAALANPTHIIWGYVRAGGRFDAHLTSLGYNRQVTSYEPLVLIGDEYSPAVAHTLVFWDTAAKVAL